jgi:Tfp pilus assembly pilus retraction ATPase PilT
VRLQLAPVLRAVVVQRLLPAAGIRSRAESGKEGELPRSKRRVAACEILVNTPAIAHCIATSQTGQIGAFIDAGSSYGMQRLEQHVAKLVQAQKISTATAAMVTLQRSGKALRCGVAAAGGKPYVAFLTYAETGRAITSIKATADVLQFKRGCLRGRQGLHR